MKPVAKKPPANSEPEPEADVSDLPEACLAGLICRGLTVPPASWIGFAERLTVPPAFLD